MAIAQRAARAFGLARSLAIYYGIPGRARRLRNAYGRFIAPGALCFDIGAHVGNRTRCWLDLGARVIAVEPDPAMATVLRALFGRRPSAEIVETAVGASAGSGTLYVSRRTPTVTTLSADWMEAVSRSRGFGGVAWDDRRHVEVTTLDALIARYGLPDFCKIDVEGFEAEVLAGLSQPLPALSFEVVPAARWVADECLERLGKLADYRFNITVGERHAFAWRDWIDAAGMRAWLSQRGGDDPSGDIYALLRYPAGQSPAARSSGI